METAIQNACMGTISGGGVFGSVHYKRRCFALRRRACSLRINENQSVCFNHRINARTQLDQTNQNWVHLVVRRRVEQTCISTTVG